MVGRIRPVVLTAALLVLGATAGIGAVSAAVDTGGSSMAVSQTTNEDLAVSQTTDEGRFVDANLTDGGVYWQGQRLMLGNLSATIANNTNLSNVESLHLRRYNADDDELGAVVRTIDIEPGNQTLTTAGLEGTYVLLPADQRTEVLQFSDGSLNGTAPVSAGEPFEVLVQTLSVAWEPSPSGAVGSGRQIDIRSNRLRYNLNVSSPSLSYDALETAFMSDRFLRNQNEPFGDRRPFERRYRMYNVYADSDVIVLRGFKDGALRPNFDSLDRLPETIRVEVTDTGVTDRIILSSGGVTGSPFNITRLAFTKDVQPGQQVTLRPTIKNEWQQSASGTITFELGDDRTTTPLTLESGESTQTSATLTAPSEPGNVEYNVSVGGESATGTVIVLEPPDPEESETKSGTDEESSSGLLNINLQLGTSHMGGIMTVLSLLTVILFRRR
jgi:hypothetical protein